MYKILALLLVITLTGCGDSTRTTETISLPASSTLVQDYPEKKIMPRAVPTTPAPKPTKVVKRTRRVPERASRSRRLTQDGVWDRLASCETGGDWSTNTGNGYYGGVQFSLPTWRSVGGTGLPSNASKSEQIRRAKILLNRSGWGQWPACSRKLGYR